MTKQKEPAYVAATLKWCNTLRKKRGKKPMKRLPKGRRRDAKTCPCGIATGCNVGVTTYWWPRMIGGTHGYNIALPRSVAIFVDNFDAGNLPQYEL